MLLLSARGPRPPGRREIKMNEDLENLSRTCFVRERNLGRRYSDCWDWRIGQVRCLDNPKRWRIYISCGRWFSKIITKRLRIPRTQSETGMKSFDLKNKKMTEKIGNNFSLFKDASFIVITLNREFNLRAERGVILYFTRLTSLNETFPRRNTRRGRRIGEKPKHLRQTQI